MTKLNEKSKGAAEVVPKGRTGGRAVVTNSVTPKLAGKVEKTKPPPQLESSPGFLYTHDPERWTVISGEVVPSLSKLKLQPGCNGVVDTKDGEINATAAIDDAVNNGKTVIPWDVDGPGTSYLVTPKGRPDVHLSRFERVYAGSNQIDSDEKAYVGWLKSLVARDIVAPCPDHVLARMEGDLVKQIGDLELRPGQGAFRAVLQRNLAGVLCELAKLNPEPVETEPVKPPTGATP